MDFDREPDFAAEHGLDPTEYGLYDTKGKCWMGDDNGPKTYSDFMIARVAAQMVDVQLGQRPGRTRAKEYDGTGTRLRETVKTRMSPLDALRAMESGRVM